MKTYEQKARKAMHRYSWDEYCNDMKILRTQPSVTHYARVIEQVISDME